MRKKILEENKLVLQRGTLSKFGGGQQQMGRGLKVDKCQKTVAQTKCKKCPPCSDTCDK